MVNDIHTTFHEWWGGIRSRKTTLILPLFGLHYCQILKSHSSIVSFGREIMGK